MAISVSITANQSGGIDVSWDNGDCLTVNYFSLILYKDNNQVALYDDYSFSYFYTFTNVGSGSFYVQVFAFYQDPWDGLFYQCDSGMSNTIQINNFCIPSNATNMSMRTLARFYGVSVSNIQLSGPNNPSTSGSIFGNSDLPNTGTISKSRPNAVSELRGRCGGLFTWEQANSNVSAERWIAVGDGGVILTSLNGITWNVENSGTIANLRSVERNIFYTNDAIVVGDNGTILYSRDGVFWANIPNNLSGTLTSVSRATQVIGDGPVLIQGSIIVGNSSGTVFKSSDMFNWTSAYTTGQQINNLFEFGSFSGYNVQYLSTGNNGTVFRSNAFNDPTSATNMNLGVTTDTYGASRTQNASRLVVCGDNGMIRTTDNGTSWTARTSGVSSLLRSMTLFEGVIIAVGSTQRIITSSDSAVTWVNRRGNVDSNILQSVASIPGNFAVSVGQGGTILYSSNGLTWNQATSPVSSNLNFVERYVIIRDIIV